MTKRKRVSNIHPAKCPACGGTLGRRKRGEKIKCFVKHPEYVWTGRRWKLIDEIGEA